MGQYIDEKDNLMEALLEVIPISYLSSSAFEEQCIRGTGNMIRFKPSYDYRGWSSGRLSMIIFSINAFHTPLQLQYYSRKIQVHSYGIVW